MGLQFIECFSHTCSGCFCGREFRVIHFDAGILIGINLPKVLLEAAIWARTRLGDTDLAIEAGSVEGNQMGMNLSHS